MNELTPDVLRSHESEESFQRRVMELAQRWGWRRAHFRPARTKYGWGTAMCGEPGFPDLVLVRKHRVVYAELKSEQGKVSVFQNAWLTDLKGAGEEVYIWKPSDWDTIVEVLK